MEQWDFARCGGVCAVTGRTLAEGEAYFAVLFDDGSAFRREDHCIEAWAGVPQGAFCFFKTRVPVKEKKQRLLVDNEVLLNFFIRLEDEEQEARVHFRFVLALILMRKRILKYEQTIRENGQEFWQMRLVKEQSAHRVLNPQLNDEQIERVSAELSAILHGGSGDFDEPPEDGADERRAEAHAATAAEAPSNESTNDAS